MEQEAQKKVDQALLTACNYIHTGRKNKAIELIAQIQRVDPHNSITHRLMDYIFAKELDRPKPDLTQYFGEHWLGQDLNGKSIQVICDQGMGDTINLLRYLHQMHDRYNCNIILNCYAFYDKFEKLFRSYYYLFRFANYPVPCDYYTNIMSLPALLNGLEFDVYYPVHWREVMERTEIPDQPIIYVPPTNQVSDDFRVGLVWSTNPDNPLSKVKSIPVTSICQLETGRWSLYKLTPEEKNYNFVVSPSLNDLYDTASWIAAMDVVVSVDTCVLHLAGAMGKKALGLLPYDADPRWGDGSMTCWYPTVELFRQPESLDWSEPIKQVRERLTSLALCS